MYSDKDLVIFDLDGTLTESKADLEYEMTQAFTELLENIQVAVISGCACSQFENQFLQPLDKHAQYWPKLSNLYLLPTSGSQLYEYAGREAGFYQVYNNDLTLTEKVKIYNAWESAVLPKDFKCEPYGEVAEDRESQITFSMCGQQAPLSIKKAYDPDATIRSGIASAMRTYLPSGFEIRLGGTTSIDVTRAGIDKAYGIEKLIKWTRIDVTRALFVGDALYAGGNDSAAKKTGIECVEVSGPEETLGLIKKLNEETL